MINLAMHRYVVKIKDIRRREERARRIKELIGGSASAMDAVDKQKALFEMFRLKI